MPLPRIAFAVGGVHHKESFAIQGKVEGVARLLQLALPEAGFHAAAQHRLGTAIAAGAIQQQLTGNHLAKVEPVLLEGCGVHIGQVVGGSHHVASYGQSCQRRNPKGL